MVRGYDRTTELDAVLESRGEEIAVGVERAAAFLATSSRSAPQVRMVYICGGGSRTPGLADILGKRLGLKVEYANPLANVTVRDGALAGHSMDDIAPLLMLPVGLGLRQS
jgi:type IV pilus assembly protein PilM